MSRFLEFRSGRRRVASLFRALTAGLGLLAVAMLPMRSASAQTTSGAIRGYVRDENHAGVTSVQLVARSISMGITRSVTTNADGFYYMGGLRPGQYELTTRRIGFGPQTRTVTVQIAQTLTADFQLTQAATQLAAVTVTSQNEVQTSEQGGSVSQEQIRNLPNFERNVLDLARLVPGVTQPVSVNSTDKTFAAGGQPPEAINVFIDGATYKNDVLRGGVAGQDASKGNPFPQGAIQEFRVLTQNYKAEYQKASSAVIVATTRSGGNQWEGDLFAYGVGNSYVARDAFAAEKNLARPDYKRLQAGGNIGGPLVKDKLFFFGNYELNFRDEPAYITLGGDTTTALTANPSLVASLRPYAGQRTQQFREHLGFAKLTWAKSDRSTIDFSGNLRNDQDFRGFGGQTAYEAAENMKVTVFNGVVNWKYAGDRWLNEAQINGQNFIWNPNQINSSLVGKNYFGLMRIGGKDTRQEFTQNRLSLRDDITRAGVRWNGDHVIKMGGSVDFLGYKSLKQTNINPVFNFRSDENWAFPFQAQFGFGNPRIATNNTQLGAFAQDDWTIGRLVLNLGVRWDVETNPINNGYRTPTPLADSLRGPLAGQFYVLRPTSSGGNDTVRVVDELGGIDRYISNGRSSRPIYWGEIQPRLGASYDLKGDGRTILFGGAGIYYDRNYWNTLLDEQFRRQYQVLTVNFNQTGPTPTCTNCVQWDAKYYDPSQLRTLAGTAGLPEVFLVANNLRPPKTYQFSAGVRQAFDVANVSLSYNGIRGMNGMNFVRATPWGGLGPNYAQAFVTDDRVRTWFDALELQIERPMGRRDRWGGSLAYTLARTQEQGQSTDIFWPFDDRYPTVGDLPKRRAPGNQTHTIVANATFRLPYQIMLSSIVNLGSGLTVNATNASGGWNLVNQTTYVYTPPTRPFLGIGHVFATENMDLRLQKDVPLASGQTIGVLADVFNVFNSANWGCYDATIYPTTGNPNANYGNPGCAALGRRLQIGLRYGFHPNGSGDEGR